MSGAGPAAPPAPAITSPARASILISLKPRSAAKQGLEPRMWRSTADRWRNSPRLERWPVAVQWTQTKRRTGAGGTRTAGPAGPGPAIDAIAAKMWRQRTQVQRTWTDRHVTGCIACQEGGEQTHTRLILLYGGNVQAGRCTKKMKIVQTGHVNAQCLLVGERKNQRK